MKILLEKILRQVLKVFFVFPIKQNRLIFSSFNGKQYSCNPKYISEYLIKNYPDRFEIIWIFRNPNKFSDINGIKPVKLASLKCLYYFITSKVIVDNVEAYCFLPKRKGQLVINTWHGGGAYKRIRFAIQGKDQRDWQWSTETASQDINLFLSSSECFTKTSIVESFHYNGKVLNSGMPRNDVLINPDLRNKAAARVRNQLKIDGYIVLYAPTFRKNLSQRLDIPFEKIISSVKTRTKEDVVILARMHSNNTNNFLDAGNSENIIDVTNYPDMQELLCAADILITDYSSSMWDFSLMKKMCFLYVPDFDDYQNNDRGFYRPMQEWPGELCRNIDELCEKIETVSEDDCAVRAHNHLKALGSYENGTATKQVCEEISKFLDL